MSNRYVYPKEYELKELFSSFTDRVFVNKFSQSRGIFITNSSQDELSKELSTLLYDEWDLEELRNEAYQISSNHTLNGFVVNIKEKNFNLAKLYEYIRNNSLFKKDMTLTQLVNIPSGNTEFKSIHRGSIHYKRRKPGRIEFLQYEESSFDFYLKEIEQKKKQSIWQVEVDGNKSTDAKELRILFDKNLSNNATIETIDQDKLKAIDTVHFFDELAKNGMDKNWSCQDIKHVTVRKGRDEEEIDEEEIDEDTIGGTEEKEETIEIKQAILQGQNLRGNKFVKEFETSGYKFTAMTYEFHHLKDPYIMQIKAEFKGRPKVFEVSIKSYEENTGVNSIRKPSHLTDSQNRTIRSMFWNNAKNIYENL